MGQFIAKTLDRLSFGAGKDSRILMVGLDAAGKTSILYKAPHHFASRTCLVLTLTLLKTA